MHFISGYSWLFGLAIWCWFHVVFTDGRTVITIESSSSEEHRPSRNERCSCTDHMKNQDETDVDCGGSRCSKCENMKRCRVSCDCLSDICYNNKCVPPESCVDNIKNQDETDIDCGGHICAKCNDTKTCYIPYDCISGACENHMCVTPESCTDNMKNQDESDIDCGGHMCPKCMDTKTCSHSDDCLSGNCDNNICAPPETCTDNMKNQDESDIDCGGLICQKCMDTKTCSHSNDCLSGNCDNNICAPPETCTDNIKNQDESDIDCGGLICPKCMDGKICNTSTDCDSNQCGANVCQTCSLNGFSNGGFESGNSNGWTIGGGVRTGVSSSQILPQDFLPNGPLYIANIAASHSAVVTNDSDPLLGTLMPGIVHSGQNAFRIEDLIKGGYASVISRQINSYFCLDIYFAWLAVVENGDHTSNESSIMIVELKDTTNSDTLISRRYDAGAGSTGVDNRFRQKDAYFYTPSWQIEHLAIGSDRIGHNFTLTVLAADCKPAGHVGYVYIDSFSGIAP